MNDLAAAIWFHYSAYYFKNAVKLDPSTVATSSLAGQLSDGLMSPIAGILADKFNTRIGKRTPWYIFGSIVLIPSMIAIFASPAFLKNN